MFVVSWNTRLKKRAKITFASKGYAKSEIQPCNPVHFPWMIDQDKPIHQITFSTFPFYNISALHAKLSDFIYEERCIFSQQDPIVQKKMSKVEYRIS